MKIRSQLYQEYLLNNFNDYKLIFLYGSNLGLIDILYKKTIDILKIDLHDPFNVSRIDGNELKDNPSILIDNINTLNMFSERRNVLLDLSQISINKNIERIILDCIISKTENYLLVVKGGNINSQNSLVKHLNKSNNCILTPCYEEDNSKIRSDIINIFTKHEIIISDEFLSHLSSKLNSDTLINRAEIDKLDIFLFDNKKFSESALLNFMMSSEEINLNMIVNLCLNGETEKALLNLDRIYEKSKTNVVLIRMFSKHLKTIEKILLCNKNRKNMSETIDHMKPPIFFKDKPLILSQCKRWSFQKINLIQRRLINFEFRTKLNIYPEKTLMSHFVLSTSVLAKKVTKT